VSEVSFHVENGVALAWVREAANSCLRHILIVEHFLQIFRLLIVDLSAVFAHVGVVARTATFCGLRQGQGLRLAAGQELVGEADVLTFIK